VFWLAVLPRVSFVFWLAVLRWLSRVVRRVLCAFRDSLMPEGFLNFPSTLASYG